MSKVVGNALPLIAALALVACDDSDGGKGDRGGTLPDGGPSSEGGASPDRGPDPDQETGDGPSSGTTCSQIMSCAASCPSEDTACALDCIAQGSADAQAKFQAMRTCYDTAKAGSCASKCTNTGDPACHDCISQACIAEITACQTSNPVTGSNSGAICSPTQACPDPGEACILFERGATKGMCLGKCNAQGDSCKVKNAATQLSLCAIGLQGSSALYCGWICELNSQTYECPDDTEYDCKSINPQDPNTKYCTPKL